MNSYSNMRPQVSAEHIFPWSSPKESPPISPQSLHIMKVLLASNRTPYVIVSGHSRKHQGSCLLIKEQRAVHSACINGESAAKKHHGGFLSFISPTSHSPFILKTAQFHDVRINTSKYSVSSQPLFSSHRQWSNSEESGSSALCFPKKDVEKQVGLTLSSSLWHSTVNLHKPHVCFGLLMC